MVLALYLIEFESYSSLEAIKKVREMRLVKVNKSYSFLISNKVIFKFRRGSIETRTQEDVLHEFYANKRRTGELKKSELHIEEMLQDHINGEL